MGWHQISCRILEHRRPLVAELCLHGVITAAVGLRAIAGGANVPDFAEQFCEAEFRQHAFGVIGAAIGEDHAAAWQACDTGMQDCVGFERGQIDVVHERQKILRFHAMALHEPVQRGAMIAVVGLLHDARIVIGHIQ